MNDVYVVILAAGRGTRLKELGVQIPKSLISTGKDGETIISRLIDQFSSIATNISVVTGHRNDLMLPYLEHSHPEIIVKYNKDYKEKSNLSSFRLGIANPYYPYNKLLVIDGDTYLSDESAEFIKDVINNEINDKEDLGIIFTTSTKRPDGEWEIITDDNTSIKAIYDKTSESTKDITSGLCFFQNASLDFLVDKVFSGDEDMRYWDDIYFYNFTKMNLKGFKIPGFVGEVDTIEDIINISNINSN